MGAELLSSVGSPSVRPLSPPGEPSSGATSHTRTTAQGHFEKQQNGSTQGGGRHPTTIAMLPDNVLLDIFDFYRKNHNYTLNPVWKWNILVHVCQTWRQIAFASPYRLDLKILCTYGTPVRKNLGIWPAFPIIIRYNHSCFSAITPKDEDNIVYALKHRDRVCDVEFAPRVWGSRLEKLVTVMQEPFPVLTRLFICSGLRNPPVIPPEFLGGSAPRLRELTLSGISYIALPVLLLSTTDLVKLDLRDIPLTGYVSPEAMVASLATLPRLDSFTIEFLSAIPLPYRIHLPPVMRTVLPALTSFEFNGAGEYLEDLVSRIDSPQLKWVSIDLQLVDYQVTQLSKFIDRSVGPKLTLSKRAHVQFFDHRVTFAVYPRVNCPSSDCPPPEAKVACGRASWRILNIAQLLGRLPALLSNVVHLSLGANRRLLDMGDVDLQHLLDIFSTAQTLHVSPTLAVHVARALENISGELVAEVLPFLDLICLAGYPASSLKNFLAARRLSGRPVTVIDTDTEFYRRLESYVSE